DVRLSVAYEAEVIKVFVPPMDRKVKLDPYVLGKVESARQIDAMKVYSIIQYIIDINIVRCKTVEKQERIPAINLDMRMANRTSTTLRTASGHAGGRGRIKGQAVNVLLASF